MAARKTSAKQTVDSGRTDTQGARTSRGSGRAQTPPQTVSEDTPVDFDQLPLALVVRDRESGKFVRLTDLVRGER